MAQAETSSSVDVLPVPDPSSLPESTVVHRPACHNAWATHTHTSHSVKPTIKSCIAANGTPSHCYGVSLAIWDDTATACHPTHVNTPSLNASQTDRYRQYTIYLPRKDGRLSWPRWLVTHGDGSPTHTSSTKYSPCSEHWTAGSQTRDLLYWLQIKMP